eukprot:30676-Chlamydomonas_euryale.AAC.7
MQVKEQQDRDAMEKRFQKVMNTHRERLYVSVVRPPPAPPCNPASPTSIHPHAVTPLPHSHLQHSTALESNFFPSSLCFRPCKAGLPADLPPSRRAPSL